ncbi:MAG TPA: hypothetical protein VKF59_14270 [Candidatus Dormibacteraeota bacterium]|nr:hypothetical protein [Candidatus Dormibacteraeota bacterium]
MSDQVRREISELVEGFGPPRPGLAARAVAGLPDRRRRTEPARWAVSAAAVLVIAATLLLVWTVRTARPATGVPASVTELHRRPLVDVPLAGPSCQVDDRRAHVWQTSGGVTYVGASPAPDGLIAVQVVTKPATGSTIGITAGPRVVSGAVLVRGHRLDGPGTMLFGLAPASAPPSRPELVLNASPRTRTWDVGIQASSAGCYAIQFDGTGFSEQAVLLLYPRAGGLVAGGRTMSPAQADAAVRAAATAVRPVLLPHAVVGADWRAAVETARDGFSVEYDDLNATRRVVVSVGGGPIPVGTTVEQAHPPFRGDQGSRYRVSDTDPRGVRILTWHEPGSGAAYTVSATGLTDAEFWQLASSLG